MMAITPAIPIGAALLNAALFVEVVVDLEVVPVVVPVVLLPPAGNSVALLIAEVVETAATSPRAQLKYEPYHMMLVRQAAATKDERTATMGPRPLDWKRWSIQAGILFAYRNLPERIR